MPGTFDDDNSAGTSSAASAGDYNNGRSWSRNSRSGSALDRHSESSESLDNQSTTSSGTGCKMMQDFGSTEYIPTRSTKTAPKVAYNPMQFVKTGPTPLVKTAQEQLKLAEEVKKVREKKKDDAEEWQSNLEGWKSSRRKRQEHVIERVTEVKRMEQEEALKMSEAAAKRLMGIREKRGKLSALYSVEDNDEIEFDSTSPPADGQPVNHDDVFQQKAASSADEKEENHNSSQERPSPYDKAIEDYVKFSTTALTSSSSGKPAETTAASETANSQRLKEDPPAQQAPTTTRKVESNQPSRTQPERKSPEASDVVTKRRSAFERAADEPESKEAGNSRAAAASAAAAAANRRSGEFSSTFKTRLSTFEVSEEVGSVPRVTPDRDPNFKNKLANFQVAEPAAAQPAPPTTTAPISVVPDEEPKPDFKAKLAAFRQVEARASMAPPVKAPSSTETQPKAPPSGPVPPKAPPVVEPPKEPEAVKTKPPPVQHAEEPIYANSSASYPVDGFNSSSIRPEPSESSDCTEDEGIRSLSPHGTPSPTSPTHRTPEEATPADHFNKLNKKSDSSSIANGTAAPPAQQWPPSSEAVWDVGGSLCHGWVSDRPAPAPPSEKPPPPPIEEDPPISQVVTRRTPDSSSSSGPSDGSYRKELRKRRSDFLGFDVNAVEDDARELAEAIPPPPDLKSLLRSSSSGYRTSDLGIPSPEMIEKEKMLAAQEREIIETLEKEEQERLSGSRASGSELHNQSQEGIEYEMTAEIEQLALEWQADAMGHSAVSAGWKPPGMKQSYVPVPSPSPQPQEELQRGPPPTRGPLHVAVSSSSPEVAVKSRPLSSSPQQQQQAKEAPPSLHSPAKPSRLSSAPKPRLHDGEAWMAKRKVATEGSNPQRKEPKDVSRHWLIQEAEQRRIDAMQERNYSPSQHSSVSATSSTSGTAGLPGRTSLTPLGPASGGGPAGGSSPSSTSQWMSRSSSSTSMDKLMPELLRLPNNTSRSTSSLGSSPTPRPLYANQEEILEYADFTGAPHTAPPVWQVRSLVSSGSMDQMQSMSPPTRPVKTNQQSRSQTLLPAGTHQPSWRSTGHPPPPAEEKEPIAPLPHSVIHTLTQRMSQRTSNSNLGTANNNYGDYMNIQEAVQAAGPPSRAGPQVPPQRPANYRHPSLGPSQSVPIGQQTQAPNNNDRMLSVSGKKKCSFCQEELGRGAAMIIESLRLFYHINCFRCCVCGTALGNGTAGTDVRVRNNNLHCHDCYSNDDGLKFSKV